MRAINSPQQDMDVLVLSKRTLHTLVDWTIKSTTQYKTTKYIP